MCEPTTIDITQKPVRLINLNDCKPGQKLRRRDGKIVAYRSKNKGNVGNTYGHIVDHNKDTYDTHTDTGLVFASSTNPPDIVEILPLETEKKVINLDTCKKGQKLRRRDGTIAEYDERSTVTGNIHYIVSDMDRYPVFANGRGNKGILPQEDINSDIVEILPLDEEIPILDKVTTVDEAEFQMWDKVNEEYYGVVTGMFARKLEDNNRKLITENDWLLVRIKELEEENKKLRLAKDKQTVEIELLDKAIQRKEYERRLIARGWYVETAGAYKGDWVNPANGWHYSFENAINFL